VIDKNIIKAGDQVKARFDGWVTEDWITVTKQEYGTHGRFDLLVTNRFLKSDGMEIIDHKPGFGDLEEAVKRAKAALAEAEKALATAKNSFPVGSRVQRKREYDSPGKGTVVEKPDYLMSRRTDVVWVRWDNCGDEVYYIGTSMIERV
jgi:hypothetical protein